MKGGKYGNVLKVAESYNGLEVVDRHDRLLPEGLRYTVKEETSPGDITFLIYCIY